MKFGWKYGDDFKEEAFYGQPRIEKYYIVVIQAIFIVFDLFLMCVVYPWPLSLFFFSFPPPYRALPVMLDEEEVRSLFTLHMRVP